MVAAFSFPGPRWIRTPTHSTTRRSSRDFAHSSFHESSTRPKIMAKQLTLGIPYRQYSILSRWIKKAGKKSADLAAIAFAEVDKVQKLDALALHRMGAELCQWVLIYYPSIADDMDDGDEEADWMDVGAIDGASIKYNGPNAWKERPLPEIHASALLVQAELKRRYYPDSKEHDVVVQDA